MSLVDNILELTTKMSLYLISHSVDELFEDGSDFVRLPTIVSVLTDGGRLGQDDKLALGNYVKSYLLDMPKYTAFEWKKVSIDIPVFEHGIKKTKTIMIIKYTKDHVPDLTIAIAKYLATKQPNIIY
ncbi:hypothetical protein QJ856_gp0257 [Tupanvirus deep ocean]|uniref:Uncharacterized protein n=2 Tax=Tupanvirus TaxID=2094720 RepID=A0AC62A9P6_9VIRU|nr:hypothetical protein QJ856_gp0257 [Tupanvirus deep ocean]QKU34475.1 hypothetical protein [Tupanvirus deep ocean]